HDLTPPTFTITTTFTRRKVSIPPIMGGRVDTPHANPPHGVVATPNPDPNRRNIRVLETTGGFNNSGNLIYYSIMGTAFPDTFDRDAGGNLTSAGRQAFNNANHFPAFLFPKANGGALLSPPPPNRRQDKLVDPRNRYFSNNPLGLWILAFVVYTPKAFTDEGRKVLDPIAAVNGRDLDGTPILTSASLIDNLAAQGLVEIRNRRLDGSQGFPWVI